MGWKKGDLRVRGLDGPAELTQLFVKLFVSGKGIVCLPGEIRRYYFWITVNSCKMIFLKIELRD